MLSYNPNDTTLKCNEEKVDGFSEENFIVVSKNALTVRLNLLSTWNQKFIELLDNRVYIEFSPSLDEDNDDFKKDFSFLNVDANYVLNNFKVSYGVNSLPDIEYFFIKDARNAS